MAELITPPTTLQAAQAGNDTSRAVTLACGALGSAAFIVSGTWTGSVTPKGSADQGASWNTVPVVPLAGGPAQLSITANGTYLAAIANLSQLACDAAVLTGAVTVKCVASEEPLFVPGETEPVSGTVTANQGTGAAHHAASVVTIAGGTGSLAARATRASAALWAPSTNVADIVVEASGAHIAPGGSLTVGSVDAFAFTGTTGDTLNVVEVYN